MNAEVQLYSFEYTIGTHSYIGEIPARSWEDAQEKVSHFGASVFGQVVEHQPVGQICSICSGQMRIDMTDPKGTEEWPDTFI